MAKPSSEASEARRLHSYNELSPLVRTYMVSLERAAAREELMRKIVGTMCAEGKMTYQACEVHEVDNSQMYCITAHYAWMYDTVKRLRAIHASGASEAAKARQREQVWQEWQKDQAARMVLLDELKARELRRREALKEAQRARIEARRAKAEEEQRKSAAARAKRLEAKQARKEKARRAAEVVANLRTAQRERERFERTKQRRRLGRLIVDGVTNCLTCVKRWSPKCYNDLLPFSPHAKCPSYVAEGAEQPKTKQTKSTST